MSASPPLQASGDGGIGAGHVNKSLAHQGVHLEFVQLELDHAKNAQSLLDHHELISITTDHANKCTHKLRITVESE